MILWTRRRVDCSTGNRLSVPRPYRRLFLYYYARTGRDYELSETCAVSGSFMPVVCVACPCPRIRSVGTVRFFRVGGEPFFVGRRRSVRKFRRYFATGYRRVGSGAHQFVPFRIEEYQAVVGAVRRKPQHLQQPHAAFERVRHFGLLRYALPQLIRKNYPWNVIACPEITAFPPFVGIHVAGHGTHQNEIAALRIEPLYPAVFARYGDYGQFAAYFPRLGRPCVFHGSEVTRPQSSVVEIPWQSVRASQQYTRCGCRYYSPQAYFHLFRGMYHCFRAAVVLRTGNVTGMFPVRMTPDVAGNAGLVTKATALCSRLSRNVYLGLV